ncbi:MAG: oxygen-independent coproporphyrinogen III oxidase [Bacteroidales bacterium]
MNNQIIEKYNIPVPRYTSYPPANFFSDQFTETDYIQAIDDSNDKSPSHISLYIHFPFCRHLCNYCGCNSYPMMKQSVVTDYIEAVKREIRFILKRLSATRKISQIHFGGGSPSVLPASTLKELIDLILQNFETIDNPEIAIECHPGYLTEDEWIAIANAGFNRISIGVQDLHNDVLNAVNRKPSVIPMTRVFEILRSHGIAINMDFIYGLPLQTPERFAENMKQALALEPDRIVTFSYAHVPWVNPRMKKLEEIGLPDQEEKKRIFDTISQILLANGYMAIGIDHFVKPEDELFIAYQNKQLHRNFQGYCTRRTTGQVYAFGVSGISQLSDAYAQNTKDIAEYIEAMNSSFDVIRKGYKLSLKEQIIRDAITLIMCNECLVWKELASLYHMTVDQIKTLIGYTDGLFSEFENDGLVTLSDEGIFTTETGKIFTRNIAAAIDPLMKEGNSERFSKPI